VFFRLAGGFNGGVHATVDAIEIAKQNCAEHSVPHDH
jgi:hypothetical protein